MRNSKSSWFAVGFVGVVWPWPIFEWFASWTRLGFHNYLLKELTALALFSMLGH